ncbi:hypothetical protein [Bosea sp. 2RAB26]|uniref:hypothetical protein n=1 Tax=Bosea sp. 2RAB26 TaxID=3237476 RepID=UPI003F9131A6
MARLGNDAGHFALRRLRAQGAQRIRSRRPRARSSGAPFDSFRCQPGINLAGCLTRPARVADEENPGCAHLSPDSKAIDRNGMFPSSQIRWWREVFVASVIDLVGGRLDQQRSIALTV